MILEVKRISIVDFLRNINCVPVRESTTYALYHAPYREDRHPSFKVNKKTNRWCDLSWMKCGDIIDLGKLIYGITDIWEVIRKINGKTPILSQLSKHPECKTNGTGPRGFSDIVRVPLSNKCLLSYLTRRGIDSEIAAKYCVELHYNCKSKPYFSIGFENRSHGYESRNSFFKGCIGAKDITVIVNNEENTDCYLFEGFMDMLSYITIMKRSGMEEHIKTLDFVVLNSTNMLRSAVSVLKKYTTVTCCLDNDDAGRNAVQMLAEVRDGIHDASGTYANFKDLNDFLRNKHSYQG